MDGKIAWFATVLGEPAAGDGYRSWFRTGPAAALAGLPGVLAFDLYEPERSHDPYPDDGPGPLLMAQIWFDDVAALEAALGHPAFPASALDGDGAPGGGVRVTHEAMTARFFPVAGETSPAALEATLSYVVRYERPAEDEAAFVEFYVTHHPPILGTLPRIRNVMCYLPLRWRDPTGLPPADYMLGNEVVFDSVDDLNTALASDVRHELREDYRRFPPFTGRNSHWAMTRTRLVG